MSCGAKKKQEQAQKSADSLSSITEEEPKYDRTPQGNPIAVLNTTKGKLKSKYMIKRRRIMAEISSS
jgi:hypothetical protein